MASQKNVLLIVIDCLRSDRVFGPRKSAVTPNIDRLCEMGTCFPNTITAATHTTASIASLLTGSYPAAHGIRSLSSPRLPKYLPTLPLTLSRKGYDTAVFPGGFLGKEIEELDMGRGFALIERRDAADATFGPWGTKFLSAFPSRFKEPWFVLLHLRELHWPYSVAPHCDSKEYGEISYDRALSSLDPFLGELLARARLTRTIFILLGDHGDALPGTGGRNTVAFGLKRTARWLIDHSGPFRAIAQGLTQSNLLPERIQKLGRSHGYHVYDTLAKVPLVIASGAGLPANTVVPDQVRTIDIAPTVLQLLGIDPAELRPCQGISIADSLHTGTYTESPALIEAIRTVKRRDFGAKDLLIGIRTPEWKFVFAPENAKVPYELYDLINDSAEKHNIAKKSPNVAEGLRQKALDTLSEAIAPRSRVEGPSAEKTGGTRP